jgi:hypothetical protein
MVKPILAAAVALVQRAHSLPCPRHHCPIPYLSKSALAALAALVPR